MRQHRTILAILLVAGLCAGTASAQNLNGSPDANVNLGAGSAPAFHIFNSSQSELLRVQSNGNVGIGAAVAATPLHISRADLNPKVRIAYSDTYYMDIGHYFIDFHNNDVVFQTTETERMRISNINGNVGIGTATPSALLDIHGGDLATPSQRISANTYPMIDFYSSFASASTRNWRLAGVYNYAGKFEILSSTSSGGVPTTSRLTIDGTNGNVGIGTNTPTSQLEIGPYLYPVQFLNGTTQGLASGTLLSMAGGSEIHVSGLQIGSMAMPVIQSMGTSDLSLNQSTGGDVVIGSSTNTKGLQVASTGMSNFAGSLTVNGTVYANYQDVAEWVPASEPMPAGTVVVISDATTNTVTPSTSAYDTGVAGVVSPQPGLLLGVAGASKAKIATTGRVRVRADATKHPIRKGDLLVTSDRPGMAMKSEPLDLGGIKIHRPGTLIGKALEPLPGGEGEILVLLSLQ